MVTRKTTAKIPAKKTPVKGKTAAKKTPPVSLLLPVSHEERWRMVAEAAYYIAQRRGFAGGDTNSDWATAEAEVDAKLRQEGRKPGLS